MISCTFLGHYDVIDLGFHKRLLQTLEELMDEDDEFRFLFYDYSPFQVECGLVVERLKQEFPHKAISRVWVGHDDFDEHIGRYYDTAFNPFEPSVKLKKHSLCRWCMQESDYVVSGFYKELLAVREIGLLEFAQKHETPELIDITTDETRVRMREYTNRRLSERDRTLFMSHFSGDDQKEIASALGMSEKYCNSRLSIIRSRVMGHCRQEAAETAPNFGLLPMRCCDRTGRPFSI